MKIIFMGKDKKYSLKALEFLIENNIEVLAVICDKNNIEKNSLRYIAEKNNIEIYDNEELYENIEKNYWKDVDLIISYLYWRLIKNPVIDLPKIGCINFHPAPLPEYRGLGGYNFAILDDLNYWGASVHYVDEQIDTGNIIKVKKFNLNEVETAKSIEIKTQQIMYSLFVETIGDLKNDKKMTSYKQGSGKYIDKKTFESAKKISLTDSKDVIEKKIRAFWFPPYEGAYIELDGNKYTLVSKEILEKLEK